MRKIIKKILSLGLTLVACVGGLCACNEQDVGKEYGATLINDADKFMREDFLEENRTSGVCYYVQHYNEEHNEWEKKQIIQTDAPRTREFIITNEGEYLRLFKELSSIDINFETQILVVHMFVKSYVSPLKLTGIKVENNGLLVTFKKNLRRPGDKDGCIPGQGCIAILMNKYDITSARFVYER